MAIRVIGFAAYKYNIAPEHCKYLSFNARLLLRVCLNAHKETDYPYRESARAGQDGHVLHKQEIAPNRGGAMCIDRWVCPMALSFRLRTREGGGLNSSWQVSKMREVFLSLIGYTESDQGYINNPGW
ncbi:hypothetical protein Krac_2034 [Ktedonobacter racemifer DSM 44963]|uniref:Uncharacterized protein n=1 Tax=Ktedonobacter racemifer DSM 44963 TaxID=485913 RepID=D6U489_KTERA|nr:hypothetical protein Krac_2034 [Ktedonobacter racemifer DSM 44963]